MLNGRKLYCKFQHTAARRRLVLGHWQAVSHTLFQHTAARRRLVIASWRNRHCFGFNTQPPEGGWSGKDSNASYSTSVSTHSRPKAAGLYYIGRCLTVECFNTQPPEGGWSHALSSYLFTISFNTQPPEGGWLTSALEAVNELVSTHSRPKAAGR